MVRTMTGDADDYHEMEIHISDVESATKAMLCLKTIETYQNNTDFRTMDNRDIIRLFYGLSLLDYLDDNIFEDWYFNPDIYFYDDRLVEFELLFRVKRKKFPLDITWEEQDMKEIEVFIDNMINGE